MSFAELPQVAVDPLLSLTARFLADRRERKIDLGVGVYRDAKGRTPVFAAVKAAERLLVAEQPTKAYLGPEGRAEFVDLLADLALGLTRPVVGLQTPGGTGALYLAADLAARWGRGRKIWMSTPSWSNHLAIFEQCGLPVEQVTVVAEAERSAHIDHFLDRLEQAAPGDLVLLQACCHNPTGQDFTAQQWDAVNQVVVRRRLVPLVDIAYQGFGDGWDADLAGVRSLAEVAEEIFIAYSCSKNFGLYRERVGALFVGSATAQTTRTIAGHLANHARSTYSMPADHGAAVVATILSDPALRATWQAELTGMRYRIDGIRRALAPVGLIGECDLSSLATERGMFAQLNLKPKSIERLQDDFGIYLANSGRVNLAGLTPRNLSDFTGALADVQRAFA